MITRPSDQAPGPGSGAHPTADPTAVPAAAGLCLLSLGGWLLNTARPWQKPNSSITLALDWTASGTLLICGLMLLARCIRTVHRSDEASYQRGLDTPQDQTGRTGDNPPPQPA
ncbi:hypothetical protein [Streptomyces sp. NBC_00503]|uniref:hypothetical protein n=1 Tax=Streptomyces sp. NBC_00503 TaxID=2903659 RepID=UPI002E81CFE2|nr:hypothetical protein [Streptomyces sp. NBC_00503]WUD82985.1 hypothetical protein OG490_21895 [Streptomyces sp. NBC_00503]